MARLRREWCERRLASDGDKDTYSSSSSGTYSSSWGESVMSARMIVFKVSARSFACWSALVAFVVLVGTEHKTIREGDAHKLAGTYPTVFLLLVPFRAATAVLELAVETDPGAEEGVVAFLPFESPVVLDVTVPSSTSAVGGVAPSRSIVAFDGGDSTLAMGLST